MALPPFASGGTQVTFAVALPAVAWTAVGAIGAASCTGGGAPLSSFSTKVETVDTNAPPVVRQFRPPGAVAAVPWHPVAVATTLGAPTRPTRPPAGRVPEKLMVALAPGTRSPIEQRKPFEPTLTLRTHWSGFPPGPRTFVMGSPVGSAPPSSTPEMTPFEVFVVLTVKLTGLPRTAGPSEIWVSCKAPGVTILSAKAGTAEARADPKRLSTRTRCPTGLSNLRKPRCGVRGSVMKLAVAPIKVVIERGLKQGAPAAVEAR